MAFTFFILNSLNSHGALVHPHPHTLSLFLHQIHLLLSSLSLLSSSPSRSSHHPLSLSHPQTILRIRTPPSKPPRQTRPYNHSPHSLSSRHFHRRSISGPPGPRSKRRRFLQPPRIPPTSKIINSNQHNINSAFYGPTWRLLRRNLTSQILHPARVRSFSGTRKWVLDTLIRSLKSESETKESVKIIEHLQYAMFCLLVFMCFGERLDERQIRGVENVQRRLLVNFNKFNVLNLVPRVSRILYRKRWEELLQIRKEMEEVLIPLIRARKKVKEDRDRNADHDEGEDKVQNADHEDEGVVSYVDTLFDLELPEEKRKLDEGELVSVTTEFLNAGTDSTATALEWIMANLVKYPHIQERVFEEIKEVMGNKRGQDNNNKEVKEEDLNKLPYLKAVILEGLRRHPPGHFLLPHAVSEDVVLNGYLVPKNGTINVMVAEMGWDPKVWENPMEFKPERFLRSEGEEVFDITGSKEIKMMPFGVGRRICPGYNLAMLHLEYFVANLVWNFEWKAANGIVDLSEKLEFTVVMANPLQWVKINVDGAAKTNDSLISCGGVIRDNNGSWILGFTRSLGSGSALLAEIWGILLDITKGLDRGFGNIIIESDSLAAVHLVNKECNPDHPLRDIITKIHRLMSQAQNVKVVHVYREANRLANALASYASSMSDRESIFENVPNFCNHIFSEDFRKVCFPRRVSSQAFC
ncbi:cytochrome P450 89A2-like [Senna tora]|uniref:Cytochrome P450 89A2-like n=1 Tax=Senna tora TaxID=362788 RepID=A0A834SZT1_9FABA|nr:cytochrome P450 89A2-like [Senna tora]